jgi:hypothetical protein
MGDVLGYIEDDLHNRLALSLSRNSGGCGCSPQLLDQWAEIGWPNSGQVRAAGHLIVILVDHCAGEGLAGQEGNAIRIPRKLIEPGMERALASHPDQSPTEIVEQALVEQARCDETQRPGAKLSVNVAEQFFAVRAQRNAHG